MQNNFYNRNVDESKTGDYMKKLFVLTFFVSVICPFAFAEFLTEDIVIDRDLSKSIAKTVNKQQKTILDKLIFGTSKNVNKEYEVKLMGNSIFPYDSDVPPEFEDKAQPYYSDDGSEIHKTDNYNLAIIYIPVNKSIMKQVECDKTSPTLSCYFKERYSNYIALKDNKGDYWYFNFDYEFSFLDLEGKENLKWEQEEPVYRTIEGKTLRLVIKYSPKYFKLTTETKYKGVHPILSYTDRQNKKTNLYLEPNLENLKADFKALKESKFKEIKQ